MKDVKEMKLEVNDERDENNDEKTIKRFWNQFNNKIKRGENSWLLTSKYSTNHAKLLVIVASHGFLVITNP